MFLYGVLALFCFSACSKPDLPSSVVRAETEDDFAATRVDLVDRFGVTALADYDVAVQELQLAGMDQGLRTTAERAASMRRHVHGKTVREVEILGWQARVTRLRAEAQDFATMLEHDLALRQKTAAAGTPQAVINRIENEQDILAKLRRLQSEAEAKLATWGASAK